MSIILENQYRIGDTVTIKGFRGEVIYLGIKSTKLRSLTGEIMIIPNHLIEQVINHSLEKSVAVVDSDAQTGKDSGSGNCHWVFCYFDE